MLSYKQDPEFRLFREGLSQSEDQLKMRLAKFEGADEQLVAAVARNTELEALLRAKDDELDMGRAVAAEATELRARVAALTTEHKSKEDEVEALARTASQETECRKAHDMWIYRDARLVVLEELLTASLVSEEDVDKQRSLTRVAREAVGYLSDSPAREGYNSEDLNRLAFASWIFRDYPPGGGEGRGVDGVIQGDGVFRVCFLYRFVVNGPFSGADHVYTF